ncbi:MAG: hypothetical protein GY861_14025 [bacterium]|nr:hypothetical protein [bacterium]
MKLTITDIIKITAVAITTTLAFGAAFQKIEANSAKIKSLHIYYKDVSTSLNTITKDVAEINGQLQIMIRDRY